MKLTADYFIGRRFEFTMPDVTRIDRGYHTVSALPDVTFVSARTDAWGRVTDLSAHVDSGGRQWLPYADVVQGVCRGLLVESGHGVPFINEDVR